MYCCTDPWCQMASVVSCVRSVIAAECYRLLIIHSFMGITCEHGPPQNVQCPFCDHTCAFNIELKVHVGELNMPPWTTKLSHQTSQSRWQYAEQWLPSWRTAVIKLPLLHRKLWRSCCRHPKHCMVSLIRRSMTRSSLASPTATMASCCRKASLGGQRAQTQCTQLLSPRQNQLRDVS